MLYVESDEAKQAIHDVARDAKTVYARRDEDGNYYYYNLECSFDIETT